MRPSSRLKDIAESLKTWTPESRPAMTWFLPELRELLGASFAGAYRPLATDEGWSLEFMHGAGETAATQVRGFEQWVARLETSNRFAAYNPYAVEPEQRNRTFLTGDLVRSVFAEHSESLYRAVGLPGQDQVRVLLCDGSRLLSWLGASRQEPFTRREAGVLRYLTRPVQQRLRLERQLRPAWPGTLALEAALEALGRPAFLIGPRGTIDFGNTPGSSLLERDPRGVLASIEESALAPSGAPFAITRLAAAGSPAYLLAIQRDTSPGMGSRVAEAQRRWGLTARQTQVLELMVTGATNKDIARQSGCAVVTVEKHVTDLYRRSGSRSRADLLRRLFGAGPGG
jgi:DNA-binding CsgD family transcriptional regulator